MVPAWGSFARRRPPGRRAGPPPLPLVAHSRPARPPCPPPDPENQPGLAVEERVPHLLAAHLRPARARLTSTSHPPTRKEAIPARSEPGLRPAHQAARPPRPHQG